jgi:hypothetical protein
VDEVEGEAVGASGEVHVHVRLSMELHSCTRSGGEDGTRTQKLSAAEVVPCLSVSVCASTSCC